MFRPILGLVGWTERFDRRDPEVATLKNAIETAPAGRAIPNAANVYDFEPFGQRDQPVARDGSATAEPSEAQDPGAPADVVRVLFQARDLASLGQHKIVLTRSDEAALQWEDGLTSLKGHGRLPLDEVHAGFDDLFDLARTAEADGQVDDAVRFYDMCCRADRRDEIAPYNLGNIHLAQGSYDEAILAYQQALTRNPGFIEARYNLALALEAVGKVEAAQGELSAVLGIDGTYADAVFNLAQLRMKAGDVGAARTLYERYLTLDPPDDWTATTRKAITYCAAMLLRTGCDRAAGQR
jgi:tetratricopeptide (TPR) repeat protein